MDPPSWCLNFLAFYAKTAYFRIFGSGEFFPLRMHSSVTLPPQYSVNLPSCDFFI